MAELWPRGLWIPKQKWQYKATINPTCGLKMSTTLEKLEKMRSKKQLNFGQEFYGNSNKVTIVKKIRLLLLYSPVYVSVGPSGPMKWYAMTTLVND